MANKFGNIILKLFLKCPSSTVLWLMTLLLLFIYGLHLFSFVSRYSPSCAILNGKGFEKMEHSPENESNHIAQYQANLLQPRNFTKPMQENSKTSQNATFYVVPGSLGPKGTNYRWQSAKCLGHCCKLLISFLALLLPFWLLITIHLVKMLPSLLYQTLQVCKRKSVGTLHLSALTMTTV